MPHKPITTPEPTPAVSRTTLAITSNRDAASPSAAGVIMYDGFANCAISEDE